MDIPVAFHSIPCVSGLPTDFTRLISAMVSDFILYQSLFTVLPQVRDAHLAEFLIRLLL